MRTGNRRSRRPVALARVDPHSIERGHFYIEKGGDMSKLLLTCGVEASAFVVGVLGRGF